MPEISPPPPTGTTSEVELAARSCSISSPTVPWPAMMRGIVVGMHEGQALRLRALVK